jgi:heterodisulfide reductase subunit A-like polyferredoxin
MEIGSMRDRGPDSDKVGVVLCSCGGRIASSDESASLARRLAFAGIPSGDVTTLEVLCTPAGREAVRGFVAKRSLRALVCAGCSPVTNGEMIREVAAAAGMTPGATVGVRRSGREESDAAEIRKAVTAVAAVPVLGSTSAALDPAVVVLGQGDTARFAAARLAALGHPVSLIDGRLAGLEGRPGAFRARVGNPGAERVIACGAVVVADAGFAGAAEEVGARFGSPAVVALQALPGVLASLPRVSPVRAVGIVLDLEVEESMAGSAEALDAARRMQRTGAVQVYLFAHDLRVASPGLQELYDAARASGVVTVKYDGALRIAPAALTGATVTCRDAGLGADASYPCDLVGVSPLGLAATSGAAAAALSLAGALAVGTDPLGRPQQNNIHLLPVLTSRAGVYVAGPARGQHYLPLALQEVEAAAAAAHAFLAPRSITVELSHAVVDEEACALCLTCVRVCPHRAMGIDREKKVAAADPVACRRCGICAGECPAKAITLPLYSDTGVLAQLGIAVAPRSRKSHG